MVDLEGGGAFLVQRGTETNSQSCSALREGVPRMPGNRPSLFVPWLLEELPFHLMMLILDEMKIKFAIHLGMWMIILDLLEKLYNQPFLMICLIKRLLYSLDIPAKVTT